MTSNTNKSMVMNRNRRNFLKAGGTVVFGSLAGCLEDGGDSGGDGTDSDSYDLGTDGTIRIIVHTSEGGGYDTYARLAAKHMAEYVDNDVIVENMTGGGGQIALREVATAEPDGSTLQLADAQGFPLMQAQGDAQGWDFTTFTYLAGVAEDVRSLNVSIDSGIENFDDYVTAAQNGELNFGWDFPTSSTALVPIMIGELGGYYDPMMVINQGVQFNGGSQIRTAMQRNEVQASGGSWASNFQQHNEGLQRMIMYMANVDEPPEETPDIQTLKTTGVENASKIESLLSGRRVFVAPPEMSDDLTSTLQSLYEDIIKSDAFVADAQEAGRPVTYIPGEEFNEWVPNTLELWEGQMDLIEQITSGS